MRPTARPSLVIQPYPVIVSKCVGTVLLAFLGPQFDLVREVALASLHAFVWQRPHFKTTFCSGASVRVEPIASAQTSRSA